MKSIDRILRKTNLPGVKRARDDEKFHYALHEAGHATVALALGVRPALISIDPKEVAAYLENWNPMEVRPAWGNGLTVYDGDECKGLARLTISHGGIVVSAVINGGIFAKDKGGCEADAKSAMDYADKAGVYDLSPYLIQARDLLVRHSDCLFKLALTLYEKGRLEKAEILQICPRFDGCKP